MNRIKRAQAFDFMLASGRLSPGGAGVLSAVAELGAERSLTFEIGVLRLLTDRLMAVDGVRGDTADVASALRSLTSALVSAVRLQRRLVDEGVSDASGALELLLSELDDDG